MGSSTIMCSMLLSYYFHKIGRSAINGGMDFFIDNHILREGRGEAVSGVLYVGMVGR